MLVVALLRMFTALEPPIDDNACGVVCGICASSRASDERVDPAEHPTMHGVDTEAAEQVFHIADRQQVILAPSTRSSSCLHSLKSKTAVTNADQQLPGARQLTEPAATSGRQPWSILQMTATQVVKSVFLPRSGNVAVFSCNVCKTKWHLPRLQMLTLMHRRRRRRRRTRPRPCVHARYTRFCSTRSARGVSRTRSRWVSWTF